MNNTVNYDLSKHEPINIFGFAFASIEAVKEAAHDWYYLKMELNALKQKVLLIEFKIADATTEVERKQLRLARLEIIRKMKELKPQLDKAGAAIKFVEQQNKNMVAAQLFNANQHMR